MKILTITTVGEYALLNNTPATHEYGGGIGINIINDAVCAKETFLDETIIVCVSPEAALVDMAEMKGIIVEIVRSHWIKLFGRSIVIWLSVKDLKRIIKKYKIDVICAHNFAAGLSGGFAANSCSVPMVIAVHQDVSDYVSQSRNLFVKALSWIRKSIILSLWRFGSVPRAKKILSVSAHTGRTVAKIGIDPNKIETVCNGVNPNNFNFEKSRSEAIVKEFSIQNGDLIVGSIGRLVTIKGYNYLIEAAERLTKEFSNLKFIVVGGGSGKEDLEEMLVNKNLTDKFFFAGMRLDVLPFYASFDLFILPSLMEGMPTVILEAMFAKVPVIATDVGGTPEIVVDEETGLLIPTKNVKAIEEAIKLVLNDSQLAENMVNRAYEKVNLEFTLVNKSKKMKAMYESLLVKKTQR